MSRTFPKRLRLLSLLLLFAAGSFGQSASLFLERSEIEVGDPAPVTLEIRLPPGARYQLLKIPDEFNGLERITPFRYDTVRNASGTTLRVRWSVTGFDSGMHTVPSFSFGYPGAPDSFHTEPAQLLVRTLDVDTTKPYKPIKEIIDVPPGDSTVSKIANNGWARLIAGLAATALILYLVFRNKRKAIGPPKPVATEGLAHKYVRLLGELDREQVWQSGRVKEYYIRLTDLLRGYIGERFGIHATEWTTDELLSFASRNPVLRAQLPMLQQLLTTADLAKFAKGQPSQAEHRQALDDSVQFVNSTKPEPPANPV